MAAATQLPPIRSKSLCLRSLRLYHPSMNLLLPRSKEHLFLLSSHDDLDSFSAEIGLGLDEPEEEKGCVEA